MKRAYDILFLTHLRLDEITWPLTNDLQLWTHNKYTKKLYRLIMLYFLYNVNKIANEYFCMLEII